MKSDTDPAIVPLGGYWSSINTINVGGLLSCRPGYKCITSLPEGKLQGGALFRPRVGLDQVVIVIAGQVYVAPFPFTSFRLLENLLFSPFAKQIFFSLAEQSANRLTGDFASAIELIDTRRILFMQDGANTAAAWYDGSNSGHLRDDPFGTPIGGPMVWSGDRLWVANGSSVFASDIANPFSFREQVYLGGKTSFTFAGDVTAFAITPSVDTPQLIVFTDHNTSILQSNIRERDMWLTTNDFQREIFRIGCASQRSVVSHYGSLSWFSQSGFVNFNAAATTYISSYLPQRDNEMMISKRAMSEDLSLVAGAAYGQFVLMSVPSEDSYNKHTWCLNGASFQTLNDASQPSWNSVWLGTRPVEWIYGQIVGQERIYHISFDSDGQNRLWEAFRPERLDNDCPIMWAVQTRGYFGPTSGKKPPTQPCRLNFFEVALTSIEEQLDVAIFWAGSQRGAFKRCFTKQISVARGSMDFETIIDASANVFAFKPQSRRHRSEEVTLQTDDTDTMSCPPEDRAIENRDDSFQALIVGHGPATIRWIKCFASPEPEENDAGEAPCEDENPVTGSRYDGVLVSAESISEVIAALDAFREDHFESHETLTMTGFGLAATGVGNSESIVSQEAADRVALRIAEKQAEYEILRSTAPTLSLGLGDAQ
jgi:hypothetical protein